MSAICGVLGTDGRPWAERDLAGVLHALRPLGGGSGDAWAGTVGRMGVALGSLGGAARSGDGAICLVADAVLDCRADLLAALPAPATATDADLILAAYERWGERCLDHVSGEFAFAVADARRGGVLIARDQIGVRPLQVHERRGLVAFSTTALSLCHLEGVGHELDRVRVGEWLALVTRTERTFVTGVRTFPAGHCAWVEPSGATRRRYWSVDPERIVERDEYALELRETFESAVARRLPEGEPVGVLLSGGLDSTSAAATAARLRPDEPIRTYTAAPPPGWRGPAPGPDNDVDESGLVSELAAWHPNLEPQFLTGDLGPLLEPYDELFAAGSPPPRNPCNELWMRAALRTAAGDGIPWLLTGARGNVFFSGDDPFWLVALLRAGRLQAFGREVAALGPRRAARDLARQLAPPALHRLRTDLRARRTGLTNDVELRFAGRGATEVVQQHARDFDPIPRRSLRRRALEAVELSGFIAEAGAVRDALAGTRRSDPTGDIRVIELCATQPPWARRHRGRSRAVVRDAMADRLPPSIAERTRRGAQLPDWFERMTARRSELDAELEAARESATCLELLDLEAIGAELRDWPGREQAHARWDRTTMVYRYNLFRALLMSRYVRFFEAHAVGH